jgi:D-glycero-D-manno-heptose 1,7-bisphosphate phosphatase
MGHTVFLDRDGVINKDSAEYIKHPSEFEFIPKSPEAVALLTQSGFNVIVISNQSMIGRNLSSKEISDAVFKKMKVGIEAAGGRITDIFYCPHIPEDRCSCRKPQPGLIFQAQKKWLIDLARSFMVGDSVKDIACARAAGCAKVLLVKTGNGPAAYEELIKNRMAPDYFAKDLYAAALWIINSAKP